jgi:hypothetical protein
MQELHDEEAELPPAEADDLRVIAGETDRAPGTDQKQIGNNGRPAPSCRRARSPSRPPAVLSRCPTARPGARAVRQGRPLFVRSASCGAKVERNPAVAKGVTVQPVAAFAQLRWVVAGPGFEPG